MGVKPKREREIKRGEPSVPSFVRFPRSEREKLDELAAAQGRNLSQQIRWLVKRALEKGIK